MAEQCHVGGELLHGLFEAHAHARSVELCPVYQKLQAKPRLTCSRAAAHQWVRALGKPPCVTWSSPGSRTNFRQAITGAFSRAPFPFMFLNSCGHQVRSRVMAYFF
jgi:hypothetical protein